MKLKKLMLIIILIMVFSFAIGAVNSAKFVDTCHGGDLKHKTTWEKKIDTKKYQGIDEKKGKYYKKYLITYSYSVIGCTHKSHQKHNLMQGQPKNTPYKYITVNNANPITKYEQINVTVKKTGKLFFKKYVFSRIGIDSGNIKDIGKGDYIVCIYYGKKELIEDKNTIIISAQRRNGKDTSKNFARHHKIIKAKITLVNRLNENGNHYYTTKTYIKTLQPNKKTGIITYKPKNGYAPFYAEITYVKSN